MRDIKENLRQKLIKERKRLSVDEIINKSRRIQQWLFGLKSFQKSKCIMFYISYKGEVDTHDMIQDSLKLGKRVVVPITDKTVGVLLVSEIFDFKNELEPKTYGILEPKKQFYRLVANSAIDLIIIPGVAFDQDCHRLGHGRGYYDRFLKGLNKKIPRIGLAFDSQIQPVLPRESWDEPVNLVVTENSIYNSPVISS